MTLNKAVKIIESYPNVEIIQVFEENESLSLGTIHFKITDRLYQMSIRHDDLEKEIREIMSLNMSPNNEI